MHSQSSPFFSSDWLAPLLSPSESNCNFCIWWHWLHARCQLVCLIPEIAHAQNQLRLPLSNPFKSVSFTAMCRIRRECCKSTDVAGTHGTERALPCSP